MKMTSKLLQSVLFIAIVWYLYWEYMSTGRHLVDDFTRPKTEYASAGMGVPPYKWCEIY
jgi:hypothetical protein